MNLICRLRYIACIFYTCNSSWIWMGGDRGMDATQTIQTGVLFGSYVCFCVATFTRCLAHYVNCRMCSRIDTRNELTHKQSRRLYDSWLKIRTTECVQRWESRHANEWLDMLMFGWPSPAEIQPVCVHARCLRVRYTTVSYHRLTFRADAHSPCCHMYWMHPQYV